MQGKIKWFDHSKGFGFLIETETKKEYFTHYTKTLDKVNEGDQVEFELEESKRGQIAINVKRVKQ